MLIDLNFSNTYNINEKLIIPKKYYENSDVVDLGEIDVAGKLYYDDEDNLYIDIKANGVMTIKDSISNEDIQYPYSIEYYDLIPENLKNMQETLDLFEILWENIVLEVPLRYTKEVDYSKFKGNGWKLLDENELEKNNPFSDLLKDFDKKE